MGETPVLVSAFLFATNFTPPKCSLLFVNKVSLVSKFNFLGLGFNFKEKFTFSIIDESHPGVGGTISGLCVKFAILKFNDFFDNDSGVDSMISISESSSTFLEHKSTYFIVLEDSFFSLKFECGKLDEGSVDFLKNADILVCFD